MRRYLLILAVLVIASTDDVVAQFIGQDNRPGLINQATTEEGVVAQFIGQIDNFLCPPAYATTVTHDADAEFTGQENRLYDSDTGATTSQGVYLWVVFRNTAWCFSASLRMLETISRGVLGFHSLVSWALILWSSCINLGSLTGILAHLLRGANIYLYIAVSFVCRVYANARFMPYYVFKVPAYKHRDVMCCSNGYVQGIRQIFMRYYIMLNVILSKFFRRFCSKNPFKLIFFNGVKEFFAFDWVRSPLDFNNDKVGSIDAIIILSRYCKEIFRRFLYPESIFDVKPVYNRCIYVDTHNLSPQNKGSIRYRLCQERTTRSMYFDMVKMYT